MGGPWGGGTTPWATLKHPFINLDICPLSFFLPLSPSVRGGGGPYAILLIGRYTIEVNWKTSPPDRRGN